MTEETKKLIEMAECNRAAAILFDKMATKFSQTDDQMNKTGLYRERIRGNIKTMCKSEFLDRIVKHQCEMMGATCGIRDVTKSD